MINDNLGIYNHIDKGFDMLEQHMRVERCVNFTHLIRDIIYTWKIRIFKFLKLVFKLL